MSNYEPLSPVAVEQKLRSTVNALTRAQKALAESRDAEVTKELAYRAQKRDATLSPDAPKVERGKGTTAERDAWVDRQCADAYEAYRRAESTRVKAEELLRITRDQGVLVAALSKSVNQAYAMAGRTES